ncbi:MAG: arsenite methyltransferase [Chloroflexi bacterium]|nr:arsenite methyltransferase [Chloroflexota bacterium]
MSNVTSDAKIKEAVRQTYGGIARRFVEEPTQASCCGPSQATVEKTVEEPAQASCCGPSQATVDDTVEASAQASCCGPSEVAVESTGTAARLYSTEELGDLPDSVTDISLGCGNPTAIAELEPGEVVLDLGSGGGIDCFIAAKKVGPEGRVIGLDMTTDMIRLARRNAKKVGATNVDFRYGEMEDIPLPNDSVDVIISNCVINLSPDKDAVFGEAYRVLQPGGRVMVSDIVLNGELPQSIRERLDAWAGCIAGALDESVYLDKIRAAGFERVEVVSRDYVPTDQAITEEEVQLVMAGPDGPAEGEDAKALLAEAGISFDDLSQTVASVKVKAYKPA